MLQQLQGPALGDDEGGALGQLAEPVRAQGSGQGFLAMVQERGQWRGMLGAGTTDLGAEIGQGTAGDGGAQAVAQLKQFLL